MLREVCYETHFNGSLAIEKVVTLCRELAETNPQILHEYTIRHGKRIDRLAELHQRRFEEFCKKNPFFRDFEGLEFLESREQRIEFRTLCDEAHFMEKALHGDPHERILLRRKLRKMGIKCSDPDAPLYKLRLIANQAIAA